MSKNAICKKVLSYIIIFLLSLGLSLTAGTNSFAQYTASYYPAYTTPLNLSYNNYVTPLFNSYGTSYTWGSLYPYIGSSTPAKPKPKPRPITPIELEEVIFTNKAQDAELTGDMLIDFDEERPAGIPRNYDYYLLDGEVYPDIRSYIHTPCSCCPCLIAQSSEVQAQAEQLISCKCCCCEKGEAVFHFSVNNWGIYKIREHVWAKDIAHDSFYVEVKNVKNDKRVWFCATTGNNETVLVKKAHDRFEGGQLNTWYWKDVRHWNAYVAPYEKAPTCYYILAPGKYKVIYSTRERCARLAGIKIVHVVKFPVAPVEPEIKCKEYFHKYLENDLLSVVGPGPEADEEEFTIY